MVRIIPGPLFKTPQKIHLRNLGKKSNTMQHMHYKDGIIKEDHHVLVSMGIKAIVVAFAQICKLKHRKHSTVDLGDAL